VQLQAAFCFCCNCFSSSDININLVAHHFGSNANGMADAGLQLQSIGPKKTRTIMTTLLSKF
jgi:hypothetical protein